MSATSTPRRRLLAAGVVAAVSAVLLLLLGGLPRFEYRVMLVIREADGVTPVTGSALAAAKEVGFSDDVVAAALARDPDLRGWTPERVRADVDAPTDDGLVTFLTCHTPDTSCRQVVDALATQWQQEWPRTERFPVEDPEHATVDRSPLLAAQLLLGAGGLVVGALLATGLLRRDAGSAWRLGAAAFVVVAAMRQGAFDGLLPNGVWQGLLLSLLVVLGVAAWAWSRPARPAKGGSTSLRGATPIPERGARRQGVGQRRLLLGGLALLALAALASTLVSPDKRWTLLQALIMTVALGVVGLTAVRRWYDGDTRDGDVDTLAVSVATLLGWGLAARVLGQSWPGNPTELRFQSFFFNPNVAGLLGATFGLVGLARVLAGRHRVAMALVAGVGAVTVVASSSRGALLALLVGLVVVGWVWERWRAATAMALLGAVGAVALVLLTRGKEGGLSRLGGVLADAGRLDLWRQALERWAAHPILGNGYRSGTDEAVTKTLHNVYLSVLAELGVVGALALLAVAAAVVWGAVLSRRPWLLGAAVALAVAECFDSTLIGFLGPVALPGWLLLAATAWAASPVPGADEARISPGTPSHPDEGTPAC